MPVNSGARQLRAGLDDAPPAGSAAAGPTADACRRADCVQAPQERGRMPRYYCDYCDAFLTHDVSRVNARARSRAPAPTFPPCAQPGHASLTCHAGCVQSPSVRKQHNMGRKHRDNVRALLHATARLGATPWWRSTHRRPALSETDVQRALPCAGVHSVPVPECWSLRLSARPLCVGVVVRVPASLIG